MFFKSILLAVITIFLSISVNAATITVTSPAGLTVDSISDPDNILYSNLGLTTSVGDTFVAQYAIDDSVTCYQSINEPHNAVYDCDSTDFNQFVEFGNGDRVSNNNFGYRISILDDYSDECYGTGDAWAISTKIGGPYSDNNGTYLLILDIILISNDLNKHSDTALYFNDTLVGWDSGSIQIGKWYGDLDLRNTVLLRTLACGTPPPPPTITISVDIKPGSDPNSINLCSNGTVPVAIFGSNTFNVTDVNTDKLRFAEASVKVVGKKDTNTLCSYEDINSDFLDDLICHYVTTDIAGIDGESTTATVNGELFDGTPIQGTDSINIVKETCN